MSDLLRTILIMSLSGGIVAVLLFALKPFVRNRLPKSTQYYLWLVVFAALLVPISTFIKLPAATETSPNIMTPSNLVARYVTTQEKELSRIQNIPAPADKTDSEYVQARREAESIFSIAAALFTTIYPIGILVVLLYYIVNYDLFVRMYRRRNIGATAEETAMLAELNSSKRAPLMFRNPLTATPMLIGVFCPAIILPDRVYTDTQLRSVLLHELTHLRRNDILVKWLTVLVAALHWFNPVVWLARREIDRACELSCDEAVIRNFDASGRQTYGETLIYVAADSKTPHAVLSTTMCEEKKALKERLGAIMKNRKHSRFAIVLSVVLLVVIGGAAIALGAGRATANNLIEMKIVYQENPAYFLKDMKLIWDGTIYHEIQMENPEPGAEIGCATDEYSTWRIYKLAGYNRDYLLAVESEDVWRVLSSIPPEQPLRQYILENATEKQRAERLLSVTLYSDGTATLATPLISSYVLPPCTYAYEDGELLIYAMINDEWEEGFFGISDKSVVARFDVADDNTIVFKSAAAPLFADSGARYAAVISNELSVPDVLHQRRITLDELRVLASKGDNLLMEDFSGFEGRDIGSGLFIMLYNIEGGYDILVGNGGTTGTPFYVTLQIPGVKENIDIRYNDIDVFLNKYPVPDEISAQVNKYLNIIMSSPGFSSRTGDYIDAHRDEYNTILDMGVSALPALNSVLENGDMGLRGNIAALLLQEIVTIEKNKVHSEWLNSYLDFVLNTYSLWSKGIYYPQP